MNEYMSFWWAKFLVELQISSVVFLVLLVIGLYPVAKSYFRQWRCKHETYWENRSCDAICTKCEKNLGFVGTVRKMKNHREVR